MLVLLVQGLIPCLPSLKNSRTVIMRSNHCFCSTVSRSFFLALTHEFCEHQNNVCFWSCLSFGTSGIQDRLLSLLTLTFVLSQGPDPPLCTCTFGSSQKPSHGHCHALGHTLAPMTGPSYGTVPALLTTTYTTRVAQAVVGPM